MSIGNRLMQAIATGGGGGGGPLPAFTDTWITSSSVYPLSAHGVAVVALPDGRLLGIGGNTTEKVANTYFGTISGNTINWVAGTAYPVVGVFAATLLNDGRVFVDDGANCRIGTISGNVITWATATSSGDLLTSLITLPDGRIVCSGFTNFCVGTVSGNTVTWVKTAQNANGRYENLTRLADGRLLGTGGGSVSANTTHTFIYTIAANGTMTYVASTATATNKALGAGITRAAGDIRYVGGIVISTKASLADSYAPTVSGNATTWAAKTSIPVAKQGMSQSCAMTPDGRIWIVGGSTAPNTKTNTIQIGV